MNGEYEIDEATFKSMETDNQLWILYKTFNQQRDDCELRFCTLEKRKKFDTATAGGSGLLGGFLAVVAKWIMFR